MPKCPYCNDELEARKFESGGELYKCSNPLCPVRTEDYFEFGKLKKLSNALSSETSERLKDVVEANPSVKEAVMDDIPLRKAVNIWVRASNLAKKGVLEEIVIKDPGKLVVESSAIPGAWSMVRYWGPRGFSQQNPDGISKSQAENLYKKGKLAKTHELMESAEEAKKHGRGEALVFPGHGRMVYHRHWEVGPMGSIQQKRGLKALSRKQELADAGKSEAEKRARKIAEEETRQARERAREIVKKEGEVAERRARDIAGKMGGVGPGLPESDAVLRGVDEKLTEIIEKYDINNLYIFLTPTNLNEEKGKFFEALMKGEVYNPRFEYEGLKFVEKDVMRETGEIMRSLRDLRIDYKESPWGRIIEKKRIDLMSKLKFLRLIGTPAITKYSIRVYGLPNSGTVKKAEGVCKKHAESEMGGSGKTYPYNPEFVKKRMEEYMHERGIKGWKVEITETPITRVHFSEKMVEVPRKKVLNVPLEKYTEGLVRHEVGWHVERSARGAERGYGTLRYGTSGYWPTEEGGALHAQAGGETKEPEFAYALRVIATHYALKMGFHDLFVKLKSYGISDEECWMATFRAKRGLRDSKKPGGFVKDWVYFGGYSEVKEFIEAGGDLEELRKQGAFGLGDLPYLEGKKKPIGSFKEFEGSVRQAREIADEQTRQARERAREIMEKEREEAKRRARKIEDDT